MKILRQGKNVDSSKLFECCRCGCVYECGDGEYDIIPVDLYAVECHSKCPACGKIIKQALPENIAEKIRELPTVAEITDFLERYHNNELDWDGNPV